MLQAAASVRSNIFELNGNMTCEYVNYMNLDVVQISRDLKSLMLER